MTCARKHTLVTGASSGIGRATALRLGAALRQEPAGHPQRAARPVLDMARRRVFRLPAPGSLAS